MILLNFSHPVSASVLEAIADSPHNQGAVRQIVNVTCQADNDAPFAAQATELVEKVGWAPDQWQQNPFIFNPPGLAALALAVTAEIHGRCGYFPPTLRLKPVKGAVPVQFAFGEIMPLAEIREEARKRRAK